MSRLFNPAASNPFLRRPESPYATNQFLPQIDPAQEQSTLAGMAESGLGGLAYLGKLADKTFGGRAIRGVLGGHPEELLSVIPLSDTFDLTDPENTVWGRDLLARSNIVGPDDPTTFGWDDAAGIAAEIALDPATYLGFGPLTRAGMLAKQTASLSPELATTASRIGGFGARESDLLRISPDLTEARRIAGLDHTTPILPTALEMRAATEGVDLLPRFELQFGPTAAGPGAFAGKVEQTATPLAGAIGLGLPFGQRMPFLTGQTGRQVAKYLPYAVTGLPKAIDYAVDRATGFSPLRAAGALFDPAAKGATSAGGQALARTVTTPSEAAHQAAAQAEYARRYLDLKPYLERGDEATQAALRLAREAAERVARVSPENLLLAGQHFQPDEIANIQRLGGEMGDFLRGGNVVGAEANLGADAPELLDNAIEYFTRHKTVLPMQSGETPFTYANRIVREYGARHQSQIARDPIFKNVPGGTVQINEWARNPMLSGSKSLSATNPLQARAYVLDELTGGAYSAGGQIAPEVAKQADSLVDWLARLSDDYATKNVSFFSDDLPADFLNRLNRSAVVKSAAETTYEGIARLARPLNQADPDLVPLDQVLKSAGLTGTDMTGAPVAYEILMRKLGIAPNDIARYGVPGDVARDMQRINQAWINPGEMLPVLAAWDGVSNLMKTYLTAPFVSFHTRNGLSAVFNMWRGDAMSPDAMAAAWSVTRGHPLTKPLPGMTGSTPAEWTRQLLEELMGNGVAYTTRPTQTADVMGAAGQQVLRQPNLPVNSGRGLIGDITQGVKDLVPKTWEQANPLNVQGVNRGEDVNSVIKGFRAAGQQIEDWTRVSHYLAKRQQGFNPAAAALEVKKYQLDYSYLSNTERQVMKRILPWYSFSRRNLPPLLDDLATNPSKLTASLRGVTRGRTPNEFIPEYVAEGASIPIPGAEAGSQRYIRSFGLPFEDETIKALGSVAQGDLSRASQQALGMTQPMIRAPLEYTFGTQLYSGRPLTELRPSATVDALTRSLGGNPDTARKITELLQVTPLSRVVSTSDRIIDDRKPIWQRGVNVTTGVQIGDAEIDQQRDAAYKRMLDEVLTGRPGVRQQQGVYLSKPMLAEGRIDPATLLLYRMYLDSDRRVRDMPK